MLKSRLVIAAILIPVVIYTVQVPETIWFAFLMSIFIGMAAWEWAGLSGYSRVFCMVYLAIVVILLVVTYLFSNTVLLHVIVTIGVLWWGCGFVLVILYQNGRNMIPSNEFIKASIGMLVLIPAWISLIALHAKLPDGINMLLFLLLLVWVADSAAYFVGCRWGKTKLASHVSPGKTWEGIGGALIACTGLSLGYVMMNNIQGLNIVLFLLVCLVTFIFSVLGDLIESLFKRLADKKDSGDILLGHGGVMDRLDSLTAASPIFLAGLWVLDGRI